MAGLQVLGTVIVVVGAVVAFVAGLWSRFNREVARSEGEWPAGSLTAWAVALAGLGVVGLGLLLLQR
jgi:hypothetical protein